MDRSRLALFIPLLAAFASAACNPLDGTDRLPSADPNPPHADPDPPRDATPGPSPTALPAATPKSSPEPIGAPKPELEACYPGRNEDHKTCLPVQALHSLSPAEQKEFTYRDPKTDPGFPKGLSKNQYRPPVRFLDYAASGPKTYLAPNFQLTEFFFPRNHVNGTHTFHRFGIITRAVVEIMQELRNRIGRPLSINSQYRSPGYNKYLEEYRGYDTATWSRHMYGDALDLQAPGVEPKTMATHCRDFGADYVSIYASGHVHCDWRNHPLDEAFYGVIGGIQSFAIAEREEMNSAFLTELQSSAEIAVLSGEVVGGGSIRLGIRGAPKEDPEELLVEWKGRTPSGKTFESRSSEISMDLEENGRYELQAEVGGFLTLNRQFLVSH